MREKGGRESRREKGEEKKNDCIKNYHSPGLVQVAERGADDLLDFALVDVDAGAEGGGLGESGARDEMGCLSMAAAATSLAISSRRRKRADGKAAAAAFSAAAARHRGADAAPTEGACC